MSAAERISALAARGISFYLAADGALRVTAEPSEALVLAAALPAIRQHRDDLAAQLASGSAHA